jgi:hypothetical protein
MVDSTQPPPRPERGRFGLARLLYDMRYRRERFRQFVGILFAVAITLLGRPTREGFLAGAVLVVLGMIVRMWASGHVKKDKQLATEGPYAFVRHPLYVGNQLIGFGLCIASGLLWSFVVWIAISLLFYPQAIRQEDGKLRSLFPGQWDAWRAKTRALVPSLRPAGRVGGDWSWRQSLVQNGEPVYVVIFTLMLVHLYRQLG